MSCQHNQLLCGVHTVTVTEKENGVVMVMRILYFLSHFYTSLTPDFEVPYGPAERWGGFGSAIGPAGCAGGAKE